MGLLRLIIKATTKPIMNQMKGKVGEMKVNSRLNPAIFGKVEHRLINNLILVDSNGKSHQIDHVEIRENGIFCIETKNYKGWIFGSANQDKWTQTLYNGEKHSLINPLKQNKSHVYHINQVLGNKYRINSVVVMVQNNAERIECDNVVNLNDLNSYLNGYQDGTHLTIEQMDEIYNALVASASKMTTREHVSNIRNTKMELREGKCPRCGGMLVERVGKYGPFMGCSNYPNCKFILKNQN